MEDVVYESWFKVAAGGGDKVLGKQAVAFFSRSELAKDKLAKVWSLADYDRSGSLNVEKFKHAMKLIALRQQHPCFGRGTFELLDTQNHAILAYWREYQSERVLVLHNVTGSVQDVAVEDRSYVDLLTEQSYSGKLTLSPYQYVWLV